MRVLTGMLWSSAFPGTFCPLLMSACRELQAIARHLQQRPELLPQLMTTLFEIVLFDDCSNQWSLSRPMLALILVNEPIFNDLKQQVGHVSISCFDSMQVEVGNLKSGSSFPTTLNAADAIFNERLMLIHVAGFLPVDHLRRAAFWTGYSGHNLANITWVQETTHSISIKRILLLVAVVLPFSLFHPVHLAGRACR